MVDVGAHFGESFGNYLEDGWTILAFEPDPKNREILKKNYIPDCFRLREEAVANKALEAASFFESSESSGISSLSAFHPTHHEALKVRVTTLRAALAEEKIQKVDFLKIDTEGHDLLVLHGFAWEKQRPEVILCEFEDSKTKGVGYDFRTMGDFLVNQGYTVFLSEWHPIVRYGISHQWRRWGRYPTTLVEATAWGNLVAFPAEADLGRVHRYLKDFNIVTPAA